MSFIKWRESFNTGVQQFDKEHQKIVELVDIMFYAVRDKSNLDVVAKASAELVAYAKEHFAHEEQAMEAVSYPSLESHKKEHALLRAKAEQFHSRIEEKDIEAATEFYRFLRDWLTNHIQIVDQAYGGALKEWRAF